MSLPGAAASGERIDTLRAMRDELAGRLEVCSSDQNFAVMSRVLMDVLTQIESVEKSEPETKGTALDELAAKRSGKSPGGSDASRRVDSAGKAK